MANSSDEGFNSGISSSVFWRGQILVIFDMLARSRVNACVTPNRREILKGRVAGLGNSTSDPLTWSSREQIWPQDYKENVNSILRFDESKSNLELTQKNWLIGTRHLGLNLGNDMNFCPAPRPELDTEYSFTREIFGVDVMSVYPGFLWIPQIQLWAWVRWGEAAWGLFLSFVPCVFISDLDLGTSVELPKNEF